MNLEMTENQVALDDLIGKLCRGHCTPEHVRQAEESAGVCSELWQQMLEAGAAGLLVSEEHGGLGFSILDVTTAYEQLGRHLAATPHFCSSVVSALVLERATHSVTAKECLTQIAEGTSVVVPAWLEPGSGFTLQDVKLVATRTDHGYQLNGIKVHVPFIKMADRFLVLARPSDNDSSVKLFLIDSHQKGVSIERTKNLAGDAQGRLILDNVSVDGEFCISPENDDGSIWTKSLEEAAILDAAYAVGLSERALEITVDYAKEREQFGKAIGSYQAISHPLVDNKVSVNGAKTLAYEAAWCHAEGASYRALALMAALFAKNTAREVTARAEQVHGGIGFTLEYDIQLFYRRAKQMQVNWYDKRTLETSIASLAFDQGESWSGPDPFEPSSEVISSLSKIN